MTRRSSPSREMQQTPSLASCGSDALISTSEQGKIHWHLITAKVPTFYNQIYCFSRPFLKQLPRGPGSKGWFFPSPERAG